MLWVRTKPGASSESTSFIVGKIYPEKKHDINMKQEEFETFLKNVTLKR